MIIETTRFGPVEVDDDRVLHFPRGLIGFPLERRFALIEVSGNRYFFWLQSIDTPELAWVVTDPEIFVANYDLRVPADHMVELQLTNRSDAQVLVICNQRDRKLTANLAGPLVINRGRRIAKQLVLSKASTSMPLVDLDEPASLAQAERM